MLSPKQNKFAIIYANGEITSTAAARLAGYAEGSASTQGSRLLQNEEVCGVIEEHRKNIASMAGWTRAKVISELGRVFEASMSDANWAGANQSLILISTIGGMVPSAMDRKVNVQVSFEDLLQRTSPSKDITPGSARLSQEKRDPPDFGQISDAEPE